MLSLAYKANLHLKANLYLKVNLYFKVNLYVKVNTKELNTRWLGCFNIKTYYEIFIPL